MAKVVSTSKNPLTEDPGLKKLLDEITDIPDELQFQRWKVEFLKQFDTHLDPTGSRNADSAFKEFSAGVLSLAKDVRRMETFMEEGEMTEQKCSVQARRCLGNFTSKCTKITIMMNKLMPPTQEAEREAGFTKFNLGAILVRDGFVEYDRLEKIKMHLATLRHNGLEKIADQMTLGIIDRYGTAFVQLLDILADLGLNEVMEQCTSFIKGEWAPSSPVRRKSSDLSSLQDALKQEPELTKSFDSDESSESTAPESSESVEQVGKRTSSQPSRRNRSPSPVARKSTVIKNESTPMKRESARRVPMRSKSVGRGIGNTDLKDFTNGMSRSSSNRFEFIIHGADDWKGNKRFTGSDDSKTEKAPIKKPVQRSKSVGPALRRNMSMSHVQRKAPLHTASLDGAFNPRASASSRGGRKPVSDEAFDPRVSMSSGDGRKPLSDEAADPRALTSSGGGRKPVLDEAFDPRASTSSGVCRKPVLDEAFDPRASTSSRGGRKPISDEAVDPRASTSSRCGRKPSSDEAFDPRASASSRDSRNPSLDEAFDPRASTSPRDSRKPSSDEACNPRGSTSSRDSRKSNSDEAFNPRSSTSSHDERNTVETFDPRSSRSSHGRRNIDDAFEPRSSTSSRGDVKPSPVEQDLISNGSTISSRSSRESIKPNKVSGQEKSPPARDHVLNRPTMNLVKQAKNNKEEKLNRPSMNPTMVPEDEKQQDSYRSTSNAKQPKENKPELTKPTNSGEKPMGPRERAKSVGRSKTVEDSPGSKRSPTPFRNKEKANPSDDSSRKTEPEASRGRTAPADSRPRDRSRTPGPRRREAPFKPDGKATEQKPVARRDNTPGRHLFSRRPVTPARQNSAKQPIVPPQRSRGQQTVKSEPQSSSQQPVSESLKDKKSRRDTESSHPTDLKTQPESPRELKDSGLATKLKGALSTPRQKPPTGKPDKDGFCPCCGQKWPLWKRIFGVSK